MRCDMSAIGGPQSDVSTSTRKDHRESVARWVCPTWSDKLLQEVIRSLLEAYYEPQFSDRSHGFRPGKWALPDLECEGSAVQQ